MLQWQQPVMSLKSCYIRTSSVAGWTKALLRCNNLFLKK